MNVSASSRRWRGNVKRGREKSGARPGVAAHGDVLEHAHVVEHQAVLKGPSDPHAAYAVGGFAADVDAGEEDSAFGRPVRAGHDVEKRGLPRPVRPDESLYLVPVHREGHVSQRVEAAEPFGDVLHAQ